MKHREAKTTNHIARTSNQTVRRFYACAEVFFTHEQSVPRSLRPDKQQRSRTKHGKAKGQFVSCTGVNTSILLPRYNTTFNFARAVQFFTTGDSKDNSTDNSTLSLCNYTSCDSSSISKELRTALAVSGGSAVVGVGGVLVLLAVILACKRRCKRRKSYTPEAGQGAPARRGKLRI